MQFEGSREEVVDNALAAMEGVKGVGGEASQDVGRLIAWQKRVFKVLMSKI